MKFQIYTLAIAVSLSPVCTYAQQQQNRDEFFWLGEINKATAVINTDEGLLDKALVPRITAGLTKVINEGNQPGAKRPSSVITFEPLLIKAAGPEVTLLHAGRSSQDMHATYRAAILRDELLDLAEQLNSTSGTMVTLAEKHVDTIVPNYTNGVAAQPNSFGHYLLGHAAGLDRDAQRIREAYARVDRSAMGTTVLNGTSWPLNRKRMAGYLGFSDIVDNAYDAAQISSTDEPVEVGAIVTSVALHTGQFVEDIMTQYAQPRPWILLQEGGGNTYVSSAMPQKRNPGLLNSTRQDASTAVTLAMGAVIQAHNITPGMSDAKDVNANSAMVASAVKVLEGWNKILASLVIDPSRALEELNSDWTASQELADVLMRKYKLPFRVGHHFASEIVDFAKAKNIKPLDFPYSEAKRIYAEAVKESGFPADLPMNEEEFRSTLDPVSIVKNRASVGGPQPSEMDRMLKAAKEKIVRNEEWVTQHRAQITESLARLDADFDQLKSGNN
ncbi:argininosuccinate lyase [Phyllobacterium myrsinacearum]|uniref:argininosuccinate lyase n=1 Tax=Phyllobacterium myrsinacearum TaxID=28101 RepID=A0A839EG93_9HYPH|nr:argininosuccinate lyase [Phyllobacterium myrsinacearum]MBA8878991.1 argininosuccinate lyase [Phyllobacterium myrsinacearum]